MQKSFEASGRVEVRSDAPEGFQRVVHAIRERLESDGAIVSEASEDGFSFHGESVHERFSRPQFRLRRWRNSRFVGVSAGEVHFSSTGDRIGIEYGLAANNGHSIAVHVVYIAAAMTLFATLGTFVGMLLLLPIGLVATWMAPPARIRDFDWYLQKAATRGLIDGAAREVETRRTSVAAEHAR